MLVQDLHKAVQEGLQRTTSNKMNIKQLLETTPRLRDWYNIGPVQCSEVEQFAQAVLDSRAVGVTADGYFAEPGNKVWVLNGVGTPTQTTVQPTQALTNYTLFGPIPVAHSFSSRKAALEYLRNA